MVAEEPAEQAADDRPEWGRTGAAEAAAAVWARGPGSAGVRARDRSGLRIRRGLGDRVQVRDRRGLRVGHGRRRRVGPSRWTGSSRASPSPPAASSSRPPRSARTPPPRCSRPRSRPRPAASPRSAARRASPRRGSPRRAREGRRPESGLRSSCGTPASWSIEPLPTALSLPRQLEVRLRELGRGLLLVVLDDRVDPGGLRLRLLAPRWSPWGRRRHPCRTSRVRIDLGPVH